MPDIHDLIPSFVPRENYREHLHILQEFFHEEVYPNGLTVELHPDSANGGLVGPTDMYSAMMLTVVKKFEDGNVDTLYRQKLTLSSLTGDRTGQLIPDLKANVRAAIANWKLYLEVETTLMK